MKPTHRDLVALKKRHCLTNKQLASNLYYTSKRSVDNWVTGDRDFPPVIYWALVMRLEGIDLIDVEKDKSE